MFALLFSEMISFFWQCLSLVDYYIPILFVELSTISPEQFCEKVNLCGEAVLVNLPKHDDACTLCHNIVAEILTKLTDPDRQVSINPLCSQITDCCRNIPEHIPPSPRTIAFLFTVRICLSLLYAILVTEKDLLSSLLS